MAFNLDGYIGRVIGATLDPDGWNPGQCVDLADDYAQRLFSVPWSQCLGAVTGAADLWGTAPSNFWDYVENGPTNFPPDGALIIRDRSWGNGYGHVQMSRGSDPDRTRGIESNVQGRYVSTFDNDYAGVIGWLIPHADIESGAGYQPGGGFDWWQLDPGDTLSGIAEQCGITVNRILQLNPELAADPDTVPVGYVVSVSDYGMHHFEQNPFRA